MSAEPIQPPPEHPDDPPFVCIEINKQWIPYLIGMVWPARYPEYWGGTLEQNRQARGDVRNLINQLMDVGECMPPNYCCDDPYIIKRIDPETGQVQQSNDNGVTWSPATGGIPSYVVQPVPPVTSGVAGTKCDAATNLRTQCQAWVDQVSNDFDTAESLVAFGAAVLTAILAAVFAVLSLGALTAVEALVIPTIAAALSAAWAAGKAAFDDYWDGDALDIVLCAAYCNIGEDGSFTDAQFSAFWNECNTELPPNPAKMLFMGFLSSVSTAGVNTMAASGLSSDADCYDCGCDDCEGPAPQTSGFSTIIDFDPETCLWTFASIDSPIYAGEQFLGFDFGEGCGVVTDLTLVSGTLASGFPWIAGGCDLDPEETSISPFSNVCLQYFSVRGATGQAAGSLVVTFKTAYCPP